MDYYEGILSAAAVYWLVDVLGSIGSSCHIDCYRKDLYLSHNTALGSPRQDINANSSAHPLLWVLFV